MENLFPAVPDQAELVRPARLVPLVQLDQQDQLARPDRPVLVSLVRLEPPARPDLAAAHQGRLELLVQLDQPGRRAPEQPV